MNLAFLLVPGRWPSCNHLHQLSHLIHNLHHTHLLALLMGWSLTNDFKYTAYTYGRPTILIANYL